MDGVLRIGTRGSELALRQVEIFIGLLKQKQPDLQTEVVVIHTAGDKHTDIPLCKVNSVGQVMDKGVFIAAIEDALAAGEIDCAVHSLKDMPGQLDPRFRISAVLPREDAADVLVLKEGADLQKLTLGTSSVRREHLIRTYWSGTARTVTLRGNVPTRLRKLVQSTEMDGILLARAGLTRLGFTGNCIEIDGTPLFVMDLDKEAFMPALCQGAVAIETRVDDSAAHALVAQVNDAATDICIRVERAFLAELNADCSVPVAGHANLKGDMLMFRAIYYTATGQPVTITLKGGADAPEALGTAACARLRELLD